MPTIRTAIVDDEPLARERIRNFLSHHPAFEVIGECANGVDAVEVLAGQRPDLVFLDIQMPGQSGFEVLEQLGENRPRGVIFCTAHDQYAVRAFEIHALDYLLKPFDRTRFQTAIQRALDHLSSRNVSDLSSRIDALLRDLKSTQKSASTDSSFDAPPNPSPQPHASSPSPLSPHPNAAPLESESLPDRIPVKTAGKVTFVALSDIDWIGSADNYVELHVGPKTHLLRDTMSGILERLPARDFVRISRTCIVNVSRVRELHPMFHGEYAVVLRDNTRLTLSRSHRQMLTRLGLVRAKKQLPEP